MATAPGNSRNNLIADKISLMNEAGLHWTRGRTAPSPPILGCTPGNSWMRVWRVFYVWD